MTHHRLKCFRRNYEAIAEFKKKSDIRLNDRNYQIGDSITFEEGQNELQGFCYTGRMISAQISYIDDYGCDSGYVNLSLENVGMLIV